MSKTILLDSLREMIVPIKRLLDLKADRAVVDKKAENVDYNENNPKSKGYIANRPCYVDEKNKVVPIDKKFLPDASTYLDEEILRPDYGIDNPNKLGFIKNRPCYYKQIGSYVNSERIELSPTSETYIDWPIQFEENAEYLVKAYMRFDGNGEYGELSFEEYVTSYESRVIWLQHIFIVPSSDTRKRSAGITGIYSTDSTYFYKGILNLSSGYEYGRYIEPGNLKVEICALKKLEEPVIPDEIARVAYVEEKVASIPQPDPYTLPTATADTLGGVKIGEGLQMTGDVLGVVPEGEWELIETFTLNEDATVIERTAYPDGTPYDLSAVKIKAQFFYPIVAQIGTAMDFVCDKKLLGSLVVNVVAHDTGTPLHKSTALYQAKPVGGFYEFICSSGAQGSPMEPVYASNGDFQFVSTKQKIDCIKYRAWDNIFPAGSYIEIWGVRANA